MRVDHTGRRFPGHHRTRTRLKGERGYVLALTAMLLIPLTVVTAFATDIGSWYAQGTRMQRAADAASLAGVVWMPDVATAVSIATQVATQNGFTTGVNGFTVTVQQAGAQQLRVAITGPGDLFFGRTVLKTKSLTRDATAEYILAVPLGSPKNFLGTGSLISAAQGFTAQQETDNRENDWLAISGKCASKEQGERYMTISDANYPGGSYGSCSPGTNGTVANTEYRTSGYYYTMDLAANHTGPVYLEVYDPAMCSGSAIDNSTSSGGTASQITFVVKDKDNTPYDLTNNPVLQTFTADPTANCSGGANSYQNYWRTMAVFNSPTAGQYYLQVYDPTNSPTVSSNRGFSGFSIRARFDGTATAVGAKMLNAPFGLCSTIVGSTSPQYSAACPQVHGYDAMGIYLNAASTTASFYLADIGQKQSGKTMTVTLWDTGEGAQSIELLNPLGTAVTFNFTIPACQSLGGPDVDATGGCTGGPINILSVSGTGTQPGPQRTSSSKYNDRSISLTYVLPADINTAYGGLTWWKVRYKSTSSVTDRTTWSVSIKGDPVHLVD
jgi:hypothetical protein